MKKLYFAALCLMAGCFAANAQDDSWIQVGESDCSTGWWSAFSDLYTIPMGQQMHVDFVNYSNEFQNWNNWLVVFTNNMLCGAANGTDNPEGYAEYAVVRCDNYGWGGFFETNVATYTSNYNWDNFTSEMNGSKVSMDIYNHGEQLELDAEITSTTGNVYTYNVKSATGYFLNFGVFFTVEGGYLLIDPSSIAITDIEGDEPIIDDPTEVPAIPDGWTVVGAEDCTAGWWSAFSELYTIPVGYEFTADFLNYNNGAANWNNWLLVLTNNMLCGAASSTDNPEGYAEYGVVRADNYGWGTNFDIAVATYYCDYNWDTFISDMNGAEVNLTVSNTGNLITITAFVTTKDGQEYTYIVNSSESDFSELGVFFTVEGACIAIDPESISIKEIGEPEPPVVPEGIVVGNTDCSSAFWTAFSDLYTIPVQYKLHADFTNYNNGADNWDNWIVVFTNNLMTGAEGYAEYGVVRCDNYGWGDYFQAWEVGTYTSDFDWDTFIAEMNGSQVSMDIYNRGTQVEMNATITAESGNVYHYNVLSAEGDFTELGVFFTVEGAYIVIDPESISITEISGISAVATDENAPVEYYDLQGRKLINPAEGTMCIRRQGTKAQVIVK